MSRIWNTKPTLAGQIDHYIKSHNVRSEKEHHSFCFHSLLNMSLFHSFCREYVRVSDYFFSTHETIVLFVSDDGGSGAERATRAVTYFRMIAKSLLKMKLQRGCHIWILNDREKCKWFMTPVVLHGRGKRDEGKWHPSVAFRPLTSIVQGICMSCPSPVIMYVCIFLFNQPQQKIIPLSYSRLIYSEGYLA